eukprot:366462-Chlamydomonas_euryale.AAC.40
MHAAAHPDAARLTCGALYGAPMHACMHAAVEAGRQARSPPPTALLCDHPCTHAPGRYDLRTPATAPRPMPSSSPRAAAPPERGRSTLGCAAEAIDRTRLARRVSSPTRVGTHAHASTAVGRARRTPTTARFAARTSARRAEPSSDYVCSAAARASCRAMGDSGATSSARQLRAGSSGSTACPVLCCYAPLRLRLQQRRSPPARVRAETVFRRGSAALCSRLTRGRRHATARPRAGRGSAERGQLQRPRMPTCRTRRGGPCVFSL